MQISAEAVLDRWSSTRWFVAIGVLCVTAGGLVAAVARPLDFVDGSWLAAYLVLVAGVAQIALGMGQALLSERPPTSGLIAGELVTWNAGSAIIILGSLIASPVLTSIGGVIFGVSLAIFISGVAKPERNASPWLLWIYRGLGMFVLLSIPVGLILSWTRHS